MHSRSAIAGVDCAHGEREDFVVLIRRLTPLLTYLEVGVSFNGRHDLPLPIRLVVRQVLDEDDQPNITPCFVDHSTLRKVLEDERVPFCIVVPPHLELGLVARGGLHCVVKSVHDRGVLCSCCGLILYHCVIRVVVVLTLRPTQLVKHGVM